ncbi:hypothetical protein ACIA8K_07150 [Catenuloplanes sp. NPDC051500]|uniref:hypothetical protein n=1 Tax=Catenuloplanes sp. NPDC051500 TaxID=3363959 RepID=UPI00379CB7D1
MSLISLLPARPDDPTGSIVEMETVLTPTGIVAVIVIAFVFDYMSVGPNSFRDRFAFLCALVALHDGFDGSPLDQWTITALSGVIEQLLEAADGTRLVGTSVNMVVSILVGVLWIYAIGCMLPEKTPRMGRFVAMTLPTTPQFKLNAKVWAIALALGMFTDLPYGFVGETARGLYSIIAGLVSPLPGFLFGVI